MFLAHKTRVALPELWCMQNIQSPPLEFAKTTNSSVVQSDTLSQTALPALCVGRSCRLSALCLCANDQDEFVHYGASSRRSLRSSQNSHAARL